SSFASTGRRENIFATPSRIEMDWSRIWFLTVSQPGGLNFFIMAMMLSLAVTVPSKSQKIIGLLNLFTPIAQVLFVVLDVVCLPPAEFLPAVPHRWPA